MHFSGVRRTVVSEDSILNGPSTSISHVLICWDIHKTIIVVFDNIYISTLYCTRFLSF